jgi:hypothetical protein
MMIPLNQWFSLLPAGLPYSSGHSVNCGPQAHECHVEEQKATHTVHMHTTPHALMKESKPYFVMQLYVATVLLSDTQKHFVTYYKSA